MSHPVLAKYRSVQPLDDEETVNKLLKIMVELPNAEHAEYFGRSSKAGRFFLIRHESVPDRVIEYIPDIQDDSSVTTLYVNHPIFASKQALIDAREEIIEAIDRIFLAMPNTVTVKDLGREKELFLPELGTAQLLDVLAKFSG